MDRLLVEVGAPRLDDQAANAQVGDGLLVVGVVQPQDQAILSLGVLDGGQLDGARRYLRGPGQEGELPGQPAGMGPGAYGSELQRVPVRRKLRVGLPQRRLVGIDAVLEDLYP